MQNRGKSFITGSQPQQTYLHTHDIIRTYTEYEYIIHHKCDRNWYNLCTDFHHWKDPDSSLQRFAISIKLAAFNQHQLAVPSKGATKYSYKFGGSFRLKLAQISGSQLPNLGLVPFNSFWCDWCWAYSHPRHPVPSFHEGMIWDDIGQGSSRSHSSAPISSILLQWQVRLCPRQENLGGIWEFAGRIHDWVCHCSQCLTLEFKEHPIRLNPFVSCSAPPQSLGFKNGKDM